MNKNDILGMLVYFLTAVIFGGGIALVLLAVHEDNDRCHYYNGKWSKKDIILGLIAICSGLILRVTILQFKYPGITMFIEFIQ